VVERGVIPPAMAGIAVISSMDAVYPDLRRSFVPVRRESQYASGLLNAGRWPDFATKNFWPLPGP